MDKSNYKEKQKREKFWYEQVSFLIPLAKLVNFVFKPFLKTDTFWKYFAFLVLFWGEKPN